MDLKDKKVVAILQARVSSSRLPAKVLLPILNKPMLLRQVERIQKCHALDEIIIATSNSDSDNPIEDLCLNEDIACFRGSLNDVLRRFIQAAEKYNANIVVRLTGDCPLIDPNLIDKIVTKFLDSKLDYLSNCDPATFPDGLDVEVFTYGALKEASINATLPSQREHVTPYIRNNKDLFSVGNYNSVKDYSNFRWTVDEPEDFELINKIYEYLYPINSSFTTDDILSLFDSHPELYYINNMYKRGEGFLKSLEEDMKYQKNK
jgi:spore coat polysaccharide biosynthesis protein SpsF (cytidylyltransferase family)